MTSTPDQFTKVSFNAIPRAVTAINLAAEYGGISRTDTLNRAVQLYAAMVGLSWWRVVPLLLKERATVRRWARDAAAADRLASGETHG